MLLKTSWDRLRKPLESSGPTAGFKTSIYDHSDEDADSSTVEKQKELGRLLKKVVTYRKSAVYQKVVIREKKKGEKVTAAHDKRRAGKSSGLDSDASESYGEETSKVSIFIGGI